MEAKPHELLHLYAFYSLECDAWESANDSQHWGSFFWHQLIAAFKAQENVYLHLIMYRAAVLNIQSHANYVAAAAISSDSHWILIFSALCTKIIVVGQVKDN